MLSTLAGCLTLIILLLAGAYALAWGMTSNLDNPLDEGRENG